MEDKKSEQKKVLSEILALSESIRQKHREIKRGIVETASSLEKTFEPLVQPIKTLTKQLGGPGNRENLILPQHLKLSTYNDNDEDVKTVSTPRKQLPGSSSDEATSTPRFLPTQTISETPDSPANVYLATPEGRREGLEMLDRLPYGMLAKEYMKRFITDTSNSIDHTYGPRMEGNTVMIGDGTLEFERNDLYIKGTRYTGTQGLYELIFMKKPDKDYFSPNDLNAYKSILIATNAHRQKYQPDKQINSNSGYKYRNIIRHLFLRSGKGVTGSEFIMEKSATDNETVQYMHWDDVNELVERLRLLIASQRAGHTGHDNEIVSLIEELREANVIQ